LQQQIAKRSIGSADAHAKLASELDEKLRLQAAAQNESTSMAVQPMQDQLLNAVGLMKEQSGEISQLRLEFEGKFAEWQRSYEELCSGQDAHQVEHSQALSRLASDVGERTDRLVQETVEGSSKQVTGLGETVLQELTALRDLAGERAIENARLREEVEALHALAAEHVGQAANLRRDLEEKHSAWQSLHGELSADQDSGKANVAVMKTRLYAELGDSRGHILEHGEALETLHASSAQQAEEIRLLRAELADASKALGASVQEKVEALEAQHGLQLAKRADEIQGTLVRCDALGDELDAERRLRTAAQEQLARNFGDELAVASSRQEELLQTLRGQQEAQSTRHASELEQLQAKLKEAQDALEMALQEQVRAVESKHDLALQQRSREIAGTSARCDALVSELASEREQRLTNAAMQNAELMVTLNCSQKQAERQVLALREALVSEVDALKDFTIPCLQAEMKAQTSSLQVALIEATEDARTRQSQAEKSSLERESRLVDQFAHGLAGEREARLVANDAMHEVVSGEVSLLTCRLEDQCGQLTSEIAQQEKQTFETIQALEFQLGGRLKDQRQELSLRLESHNQAWSLQASRTSEALQAEMAARVEETKALFSDVGDLRTAMPVEIRYAVKVSQEQQEAQFRLLAQDADQRSQQIVLQFQAEGHARDHLTIEIQGQASRCAVVQHEVSGLRTLIHTTAAETQRTNRETQEATARDGIIAPGLIGTAAVAAAFLL